MRKEMLFPVNYKICWEENHFEIVLNREAISYGHTNNYHAYIDLDIDTQPSKLEEVAKAIKLINIWKATWDGQMTAEIVMAEQGMTPNILQEIFSKIWKTE